MKPIVMAVLAVLILSAVSLGAWKRLLCAGRRDLAVRAVLNLWLTGAAVGALAVGGGALVEFDLLAYWERVRAGEGSRGSLYLAAGCVAVGVALIARFLQAMQATFEPVGPAMEEDPSSETRED